MNSALETFASHILTLKQWDAVGLSDGPLAKQESTKFLKSSDQSPPDNEGESFCAMWYKALIAFILNKGGFLSAERETVSAYQRC